MTRLPIAWLGAFLIFSMSAAPDAIAQKTAIEGVARDERSGAPVPFALVRLVRADSSPVPSDSPPQGITNATGQYRFADVTPGRYRVQVLRIGFRPVLSDPVQVVAGETVQLDLRVASQPLYYLLVLPEVAGTAEVCVTSKELLKHPQLQTLWQQARDGASVRTELMARFRYQVLSREESYELKADGPTAPGTLDQPYLSDPKWAVKNAARNRAERLSRGYYAPNDGWRLPNELDVLHDDFLKTHCLYAAPVRGEGEVGVRFRPLRVRGNFLDVRGTIWLDLATFLARRLELEYVDGEETRGTVRLDFGDVAVAGGTLRMPVGGAFAMRPSRKNPTRRTAGTLAFTYSGFEEIRPR
jgi:hypothetical protein